jgi:peroxin-19
VDDFEASLVEGMESLLRQLAGDHPPGLMPDLPEGASEKLPSPADHTLSSEEEEKAWQKALEMMLSGEGLEAMGIDPNNVDKSPLFPPLPNGSSAPTKPDFDETIRRTMESLRSPQATSTAPEADINSLLQQLGSDPEDGDLSGLLDGMMAQLMTREVLEEPMVELSSNYPGYLANPPKGIAKDDLEKYKKQYGLVKQIVATFRKDGYSDENDGKEVARLVGEMQDLGGPPKEVMGDLPEGFVSRVEKRGVIADARIGPRSAGRRGARLHCNVG